MYTFCGCLWNLTFLYLFCVADNAGVIVNNKGEMKGKVSSLIILLINLVFYCDSIICLLT